MSKIFDVITFFPKYLYFKKTCCKEANFADIIKVSTYLWEQYNLYLHFLILKNFLISDEKILISAELKGCVKWPPHLWVATKRLILNRVKASSFSNQFSFYIIAFLEGLAKLYLIPWFIFCGAYNQDWPGSTRQTDLNPKIKYPYPLVNRYSRGSGRATNSHVLGI